MARARSLFYFVDNEYSCGGNILINIKKGILPRAAKEISLEPVYILLFVILLLILLL